MNVNVNIAMQALDCINVKLVTTLKRLHVVVVSMITSIQIARSVSNVRQM